MLYWFVSTRPPFVSEPLVAPTEQDPKELEIIRAFREKYQIQQKFFLELDYFCEPGPYVKVRALDMFHVQELVRMFRQFDPQNVYVTAVLFTNKGKEHVRTHIEDYRGMLQISCGNHSLEAFRLCLNSALPKNRHVFEKMSADIFVLPLNPTTEIRDTLIMLGTSDNVYRNVGKAM